MLYFFHHYELPVILQQVHFQQFIIRNTQQQREPRLAPLNPVHHPLTARLTQLLSAVRPSATTQTTTNVAQAATSTSTTATSTVGTSAQPVTSSQTSQTTPATVESTEAQTRSEPVTAAAASQTTDPQARPTGGPDQPWAAPEDLSSRRWARDGLCGVTDVVAVWSFEFWLLKVLLHSVSVTMVSLVY